MERLTSLDIEENQEKDYRSLQKLNNRPRRIVESDGDLTTSEETPLLSNGISPSYTKHSREPVDR